MTELTDETNTLLESWIVRSGNGYFIEFVGPNAHMASDAADAKRLTYADATRVIDRLWQLGLSSELKQIE